MNNGGIVIAGGGFAGLWAALLAAAEIDRAGESLPVTLVSRDAHLTLRPRLYEPDPERFRTPLRPLLDAVGVGFVQAAVVGIDSDGRRVSLAGDGAPLSYDRLVLATGSVITPPPIPGIEHAFDVDTWEGAVRLERHLASNDGSAGDDVVVIGAGFTGIEIAAEMHGRLASHLGAARAARARVVLLDAADVVGPELGAGPRPNILAGLEATGVELRLGTKVRALDATGIELEGGERLAAGAVILATGLRASPLAEALPASRDELGRLVVDEMLRLPDVPGVFATGDIARATVDEAGHTALMSCQHAMTMGRYAGHNAARELLGLPLEPYRQERYVTCLDLGASGAVFTRGWDRVVELTGDEAKAYKRTINGEIIYPPSGGRAEILAQATLVPTHHRRPPERRAAGGAARS